MIRDRLRDARDLFRTYGARGIRLRAHYEVKRRAGLYRALRPRPAPQLSWAPASFDLAMVRAFFAEHPLSARAAVERAEEIAAGSYPFFQGPSRQVGWPPRWLEHPVTGATWPGDEPWWESSTTDPSLGDIKWIWEPARFGFALAFARAAVAGDEPERWWRELWRGFDDFLARCPAYRGPNWYCAQEAALRVITLELSLAVFAALGLGPSTAQRRRIEQLYDDTGRRIAATLGHSLSQRNNHALSELIGLFTVAVACPWHPEAASWHRRVERELPATLADQFADDGAYIQESFVYQRFALHLLLVMRWIADSRGAPSPASLQPVFESSFDFLRLAIDATSGNAPNFGANDGTLLLPLGETSVRDLRPLLAALGAVLGRKPACPSGAWDEQRCWLSLPASGDGVESPPRWAQTKSGYVWSRRPRSLAFLRVPSHVDHRPSHADALHVDLFVDGRNVLLDPGTYAYTAAPPWDNALARTRVHNTASVDDRDQMQRRGRFLWTRWTRAELVWTHEGEALSACLASCAATSDAEVMHRRLLVHGDEGLWIFDALESPRARQLRLHWNLDGSWNDEDPGAAITRLRSEALRVTLDGAQPSTPRTVVADPGSALGWQSPTYGHRLPCTAVELETAAESAFFATSVVWGTGPDPAWFAGAWDAWRSSRLDDLRSRIESL